VPEIELSALAGRLPKGKRLMGLDVGTRTIGIAIADPTLSVASPVETIARKKFTVDAQRIKALIAEREVGGIVLGLPINMDGSEGPRCQSVRQFARNLDQLLGVDYTFWDERLSTAAVQRMLIDEADLSRARRGELVDKMAAAYILQGALEAVRTRRA